MKNELIGYEEEYHRKQHGYLLSDEEYYKVRAKLALIKYFKGVDKKCEVLEFGSGLGQNIYYLKTKAGFDISKFATDVCKKHNIIMFDEEKEIPDEFFDIILSCHTLEHHENPFKNLMFLKNKLKNGGQLILILPKEKHKRASFEPDIKQHLFAFNFRTINNLLNIVGFKVVENKYLYGAGYHKLMSFSKINFNSYYLLTKITGYVLRYCEMKIIAVKED